MSKTGVKVGASLFLPSASQGRVVTKEIFKTFRGIYDKSMVDSELNCLPFGYQGPFEEEDDIVDEVHDRVVLNDSDLDDGCDD